MLRHAQPLVLGCRQLFQKQVTQCKHERKMDANRRTPKLKRTQTDAPPNQNGRTRTGTQIKTDASIRYGEGIGDGDMDMDPWRGWWKEIS